MINCHFKRFYKTTWYKIKSNFSQFFFFWLTVWVFFLFPYQSVSKFWKLVDFIDKNGENLEILIEISCQKLIVSNVISASSDHLKPKIFFAGQPWWPIYSAPFLKISGTAPYNTGAFCFTSIFKLSKKQYDSPVTF